MKRRQFVSGSIAAGVFAASPAGRGQEMSYQKTPRDAEGPYYPVGDRSTDSNDLLRDMQTPRGDVLHFEGTVTDVHGTPQPGVLLDIWHTDPSGRYDHPDDPAPGERLPDFAYWGKTTTDANGRFFFRTYIPAPYNRRPAHIHYKVFRGGQRVLTSQVYFRELGGSQGQALNERNADLQLASLQRDAQEAFRTDFQIVI